MTGAGVEEERLLRGYTGRIFLTLTIGLLSIKIGQRLLPPLLPMIIEDLGITAFEAGIALTVMSIVRAVLQYPSGRFSDRLSRKTVLLAGLGLGLVALILLTSSPSYVMFLAGIVVLGGAVGLYDPADRASLSDTFYDKRGRAFGFHLLASDGAGILASGVAILAAAATWQMAFLSPMVMLALVSVLLFVWSREAIELRWVDLEVRETVTRLAATPNFRWIVLVYVLVIFASNGVISFLPTFLITVHDFPFGLASGAFAVLFVVGLVVRPLGGWLSDRMSRLVVVSGVLLISAVSLGLLVVAPLSAVAIVAVIGFAVGQRGFGPPLQAFLMDEFPDETMGGDLGATRAVASVIGSLGPAYVGFVASELSFTAAYTGLIVCLLSAVVVVFYLLSSGR